MHRLRFAFVLPSFVVALSSLAPGQAAGQPVGQGSGPISELSTNVGAGSGPVRASNGRPGGNPGRLGGNSVRDSVTGDVVSGPVSELSVGAVTAGRSVAGGGSVGQASVGAVKKDLTSPMGEMISEPLRELGTLQESLRALQPLPRDSRSSDEIAPAEAATEAEDAADSTTPDSAEDAESSDPYTGLPEPDSTPEAGELSGEDAHQVADVPDESAVTPTPAVIGGERD